MSSELLETSLPTSLGLGPGKQAIRQRPGTSCLQTSSTWYSAMVRSLQLQGLTSLPRLTSLVVLDVVPCIRRVKQMQDYSGADGEDEDKETLMTFKAEELLGEPDSPEDEWVATHTGGKGMVQTQR